MFFLPRQQRGGILSQWEELDTIKINLSSRRAGVHIKPKEMEETGWLGRLLKWAAIETDLETPFKLVQQRMQRFCHILSFKSRKAGRWHTRETFVLAGRVSTVQKREYEARDQWGQVYLDKYHEEKGWNEYLQGRQKKGQPWSTMICVGNAVDQITTGSSSKLKGSEKLCGCWTSFWYARVGVSWLHVVTPFFFWQTALLQWTQSLHLSPRQVGNIVVVGLMVVFVGGLNCCVRGWIFMIDLVPSFLFDNRNCLFDDKWRKLGHRNNKGRKNLRVVGTRFLLCVSGDNMIYLFTERPSLMALGSNLISAVQPSYSRHPQEYHRA